VMPRQSPYHNDHPECPYVGERLDESSHARLKVKPHVEEAQDAPVKRNPMKREAKDVGPGDRPVGWFWKPF